MSVHASVITLSGELDAGTRGAVRTGLAAAFAHLGSGEQDQSDEVVVDVRAVQFLDAGTVGLLLHGWRTADDAGRRLRVIGAHGPVRRMIELCDAGHHLLDPADLGDPADRVDPADIAAPPPAGAPIGLADADRADRLRAVTQRRQVEGDHTRIVAALQQGAIDREVRATRRALLAQVRGRLRVDPEAVAAEEFLAVADSSVVLDAIMLAAAIVGGADAGDLQLYDPDTGELHLTRQFGFAEQFLTYFASAGSGQATAGAMAATTGEPVIVDDITRSPIFAGQPTLDVLLGAGCHAVRAHPMYHDDGRLLGVLSFHYRRVGPRSGDPERVAWSAARALSRMPAPLIG